MIAIDSISGHHLAALPVVCAVGGVGILLVACVNLVLEARGSLRGNVRDVHFFDELERLRNEAKVGGAVGSVSNKRAVRFTRSPDRLICHS
jgi:hypothetical protein